MREEISFDVDFEEILNKICTIITELDARERSSNCVITELQTASWNKLCDMAIAYLMLLKV